MHKLYVFPVALICLYLKADTPDLWNQFRGPNGSGVAETYAPPIVPNNKNIAWKTSLPHGFSAPTLSNSYLFLTGIREGRFITFALNKSDGQIIWEAKAPQDALEQVHKSSSPATPTPLVEKTDCMFTSVPMVYSVTTTMENYSEEAFACAKESLRYSDLSD